MTHGRDYIGHYDPDLSYQSMLDRRALSRRRYKRDWMRAKRLTVPRQLIGSLHGMKCTGPDRASGCRCRRKVLVYA